MRIVKAVAVNAAFVVVMFGWAWLVAYDPTYFSGSVRVIDGDTIAFSGGARVRLYGIDAPESRQECALANLHATCGIEATAHLMDLIAGQHVSCHTLTRLDDHGRHIGICKTRDIPDSLNARMVEDGYAMDYRHYSHGRYGELERQARAQQRGLWGRGGFIPPWRWRREHVNE